jgi:hypothetical protein
MSILGANICEPSRHHCLAGALAPPEQNISPSGGTNNCSQEPRAQFIPKRYCKRFAIGRKNAAEAPIATA